MWSEMWPEMWPERKLDLYKAVYFSDNLIMCQGSVVSNVSSDSGNTKGSRNRARNYTFVWNNYSEDNYRDLKEWVSQNSTEWIMGRELGSGTPHIQGYMSLKNQIEFTTLKELFYSVHWEKARKNAWKNFNYCTKEGAYETNMTFRRPVRDPITEYKPWQQDLVSTLETEADDRSVLWFWEPTGKVGKTALAKSWCIRNPATSLYLTGKANDMKSAIVSFLDNPRNDLKVVFMDFTRTTENYVSWEGIEAIKNGIFFSGKYESRMCVFNSPHVACFANFEPCTTALSADRWVVKKITN